MPFTPQTLEEKPYNACVTCAHIGKNCDGPNFLAMATERWCEWCHLRKDYLNWTNAIIAEKAGISKISVDRIMSGNVKDLRNTTMQAVTKALVNGSWGQYPCAMASVPEKETVYVDNPAIIDQCKKLQATLDNRDAEHRKETAELLAREQRQKEFLRDQIASKDHLLEQRYAFIKRKDRIIALLGTLLGVCLLVIIAALIIDGLNPDIGFFWVK